MPRSSWLLVLGLVGVLAMLPCFRINVTRSLPYGLYRLTPVPPSLTRGDLLLFPVPPMGQRFVSRWLPILKPIAGLPGEMACVINHQLFVWAGASAEDEEWPAHTYGEVLTSHEGEPLPHLTGCVMVEAGTVFVASSAPRSFDSRYYGAIPLSSITARAIPVFTWGGGS